MNLASNKSKQVLPNYLSHFFETLAETNNFFALFH